MSTGLLSVWGQWNDSLTDFLFDNVVFAPSVVYDILKENIKCELNYSFHIVVL